MWSWARLCKLVSLKFLFPLLNAKYHFVSIYSANIIVTQQHKQQIAQNSIFPATIYRYRGKKSERLGEGHAAQGSELWSYQRIANIIHIVSPRPRLRLDPSYLFRSDWLLIFAPFHQNFSSEHHFFRTHIWHQNQIFAMLPMLLTCSARCRSGKCQISTIARPRSI